MKQLKKIPQFKNEEQERRFWASHDSSDYVDWSKAGRGLFPNLKPSSKLISLRLPLAVLDELQTIANSRDIPYQSLLKMFLKGAIEQELDPKHRSAEEQALQRNGLLQKEISISQQRFSELSAAYAALVKAHAKLQEQFQAHQRSSQLIDSGFAEQENRLVGVREFPLGVYSQS